YVACNLDLATKGMRTVLYEGKEGEVVDPRDIAETKANQVNNDARSQGHPVLCKIERRD
ncbi:ATP-dependent Clp protease adapter ClpS, partial [Staphylococcus aureus]